jgi:hypothetical protein
LPITSHHNVKQICLQKLAMGIKNGENSSPEQHFFIIENSQILLMHGFSLFLMKTPPAGLLIIT